jgi:secernin
MCDTVVVLGSASKTGEVIFGKNSDRPQDEVQLVVYIPQTTHQFSLQDQSPLMVQATYISIPQAPHTNGILMSQPYWMWGGEMGVNDQGVVIGNEAVWTTEPLNQTGLLGMDLLRLGLERGNSARESLDIITSLLDKYGQGGNCAIGGSMSYHNSFLIADAYEAWVLETAGVWWVAEKITEGIRNISNNLSITTAGTICHKDVVKYAIKSKFCEDEKSFNFAQIFSEGRWTPEISPFSREGRVKSLLEEIKGEITPNDVMDVLKDHEAGICMHGGFITAGSQVSTISTQKTLSKNWFITSAFPCRSEFMPFELERSCKGLSEPGPHTSIDKNWIWVKRHTG